MRAALILSTALVFSAVAASHGSLLSKGKIETNCPSSVGPVYVCRGGQTCCGEYTTAPSCCADGTSCCWNPSLPNNHTCCAPGTTCCPKAVVGTTCCNHNEMCGSGGVGCIPLNGTTPGPTPPPTPVPTTAAPLCGSTPFSGTVWTGHPYGLGWLGSYTTLNLTCAQASFPWQQVTDNEVEASIRVGCTPGHTTWGDSATSFVELASFAGAVGAPVTLTCPQAGAFFVLYFVRSATPVHISAMARGWLWLSSGDVVSTSESVPEPFRGW